MASYTGKSLTWWNSFLSWLQDETWCVFPTLWGEKYLGSTLLLSTETSEPISLSSSLSIISKEKVNFITAHNETAFVKIWQWIPKAAKSFRGKLQWPPSFETPHTDNTAALKTSAKEKRLEGQGSKTQWASPFLGGKYLPAVLGLLTERWYTQLSPRWESPWDSSTGGQRLMPEPHQTGEKICLVCTSSVSHQHQAVCSVYYTINH